MDRDRATPDAGVTTEDVVAPAAPGGTPTVQRARALQRSAGNAATIRGMLGGGPVVQRSALSWLEQRMHDVAEATGLESSEDADLARAEAFEGGGPYEEEVIPNSSGRGGFLARYDPLANRLTIEMRCAIHFIDGLSVDGSGAITPWHANAQPAVNTAMGIADPIRRAAFVAGFQWDRAGGATDAYAADMESSVEAMWGFRHEFFLNKPGWDWLGAEVDVDVKLHEMPPGERTERGLFDIFSTDADHLAIDAVKLPAGEDINHYASLPGAADPDQSTAVDPGTAESGFDQTMLISSNEIHGSGSNLLRRAVRFDHDSDVLSAGAQRMLQRFVATFQGAPTDARSNTTRIELEAHTSASGSAAYNTALAQRRANAVRDFLAANGFTNVGTRVTTDNQGETGTTDADTEAQQAAQRRVDLIVDSGEQQEVAAHEFGHAFGLDDEYAVTPPGAPVPGFITGTGNPAGTAVDHDDETRAMQDASGTHLPGAISENNDGIMSLGNAVHPQHYSMFHGALCTVTGETEWALGARRPHPTRGAGGGGGGP